jgi:hypothetical protein
VSSWTTSTVRWAERSFPSPYVTASREAGVVRPLRSRARSTSCFRRYLVLQALVLQPPEQERLVGLDVALVVLDPDGVEAVDDGPVQRGAAPTGRVEEPHPLARQRPVEPPRGHGQRHVHQQVGQALVGLADVALDRGDVVVVAPERRGLQGPQQVALHLEHGVEERQVAEHREGGGVEAPVRAVQDEVVDPGQRPSLDPRHEAAERVPIDHGELRGGEAERGLPVDPVGAGPREHGVGRHGRNVAGLG